MRRRKRSRSSSPNDRPARHQRPRRPEQVITASEMNSLLALALYTASCSEVAL